MCDMQVAVAYAMAGKKGQDGGASHLDSYLWDLLDPNVPESTLTPTSFILSLHFSIKDPKVGPPNCRRTLGWRVALAPSTSCGP